MPFVPLTLPELPRMALAIRKEVIRMLGRSGSGHPGGSLSEADLLTCLFFHLMRHDPANPSWEERDRFVLSKGHGCPGVYAAMALAGYFPKEELLTLRRLGSRLQGHPDTRFLPMLEACTGSLGQGLSISCGIALAAKMDRKDHRVYCLMSDGETQEGQTWEAAAFAGFHGLDRLIALVDYNKFQLDGKVADIMDLEPLAKKWESFRWHAQEIDGHDILKIVQAVRQAQAAPGKPHVILAHTVKGKGVSFMEHNNYFHGVTPTAEETEAALKELDGDPSLSKALVAAGKIKMGGK
ncbi:MAG: transketolase [Candidatus Omnitrophica bacterium]|nr:transketolase [Candidatus Omnitrophota bacterium]